MKEDPRILAAIKEADDMLKRLEANDGRSHAAEPLRKFKLHKHFYEHYGGGRALSGGSQGLRDAIIALAASLRDAIIELSARICESGTDSPTWKRASLNGITVQR